MAFNTTKAGKKLTPLGIILFRILPIILIVGIAAGAGFGIVKLVNKSNDNGGTSESSGLLSIFNKGSEKETIKITLDEWIGWKSLIDANGGLKTAKNSIYDKMGLNIEFLVVNDASSSSKMLMKGDIQGAGYTINRFAFLYPQFETAKCQVAMTYITNYSNGGDGIISKKDIKSVNDMANAKIALPQYSEAQTLVEWLIRNSGLTEAQKSKIRENYIYVDTADEAAELFFAGKADAAATWEPYLTKAENEGGRKFFSTADATNLILDGIVFRQDFIDEHEDTIVKIIDGALQSSKFYTDTKHFDSIREMTMFTEMTDQEIIDMASGAKLASWTENMSLLQDEGQTVFKDMANIWLSLGEAANPKAYEVAFNSTCMEKLEETYKGEEIQVPVEFNEEEKSEVQKIENKEALLQRSLTINFEPDEAAFLEPDKAYAALDEFVEIAKTLNGVYIQIEGNTNDVGGGPNSGKELSKSRANAVKAYMVSQGVSADRFIIIGNGSSKPSKNNDPVMNRRTDIFFKSGM